VVDRDVARPSSSARIQQKEGFMPTPRKLLAQRAEARQMRREGRADEGDTGQAKIRREG
jgi:hypothetical protein